MSDNIIKLSLGDLSKIELCPQSFILNKNLQIKNELKDTGLVSVVLRNVIKETLSKKERISKTDLESKIKSLNNNVDKLTFDSINLIYKYLNNEVIYNFDNVILITIPSMKVKIKDYEIEFDSFDVLYDKKSKSFLKFHYGKQQTNDEYFYKRIDYLTEVYLLRQFLTGLKNDNSIEIKLDLETKDKYITIFNDILDNLDNLTIKFFSISYSKRKIEKKEISKYIYYYRFEDLKNKMETVELRLYQMSRMIDLGLFIPTGLNSWYCNKKYCPVFDNCPYSIK